ncbi:branched-chain-amino-acid aminotransferase 2, chloroplastic-like isoform X2 [Carica papaya]|uniref:branched-chain-amino-acid aminotransferase 2, chloroplastic-like isoform X2 n=1 Tax=Carica papaya TaxID=3649 RepID=UPI000B8D0DAD|nr:branched-chain-amino-acid aminotransferase 2, chloroplastic-like isoform X2 [Carica papaya]
MIQRSSCLRSLLQSLRSGSFSDLKVGGQRRYPSMAGASLQEQLKPSSSSEHEYANVDWDDLGFGITPADYMYSMKCSKGENFREGLVIPFGNIELSPSAGVLNYGQGIYEGTKAYRKEDGGIILFRPDQNAIRMKIGAERMCMPCPSEDQFITAVKQITYANKHWVPPPGKGSLYIRPLLIGSGPVLGLAPAPEYRFLIYASPVGNYFKEGTAPLNLYVEREFSRAVPGGCGGVKTIGNYAPVLKAQMMARKQGFSDVLYLDAVNKKNLEEVSSSNIFVVKDKIISTPVTVGTILEGVTRKSVVEIACDYGYQVEERAIPVDDLVEADEVFCTGTAVGLAPVGSITCQGKRFEFRISGESVCNNLYTILHGIKTGRIEDKKGWIIEII